MAGNAHSPGEFKLMLNDVWVCSHTCCVSGSILSNKNAYGKGVIVVGTLVLKVTLCNVLTLFVVSL